MKQLRLWRSALTLQTIQTDGRRSLMHGFILKVRLPEKRQARSKMSVAQSRAFALLAAAIEKAGEVPPANDSIPLNTSCVTEDVWRDYRPDTRPDRPRDSEPASSRRAERRPPSRQAGWLLEIA
jgi:hypothetical protein